MQKQMGAPDDAERFCIFGDSHRLVPADGWWRSRSSAPGFLAAPLVPADPSQHE